MITDTQDKTALTLAQRKKMLVEQGKAYRLGISESAGALQQNLNAEGLARHAVGHLVARGSAALENVFSLSNFKTAHVQTLLPLVISGVSLVLKKKALIKPVIGATVAMAAAGAVAFFISRARKQAQRGGKSHPAQ